MKEFKCINFLLKIPQKNEVLVNGSITPENPLFLMGPSGCGKSTLLNSIAGLTPHQSGSLFLNKTNISNLNPSKRRISYCMQGAPLFPHLNTIENILFPIKHSRSHSFSKEELHSKAIFWMEKLNIKTLQNRDVLNLSFGEKQRVNLARALITQPLMLLLDEPFSGIDCSTQSPLKEELALLLKEFKIPCILVSHDIKDSDFMNFKLCQWPSKDSYEKTILLSF